MHSGWLNASSPSPFAALAKTPQWILVTGPRGGGKTRWLCEGLEAGAPPAGQCATLLLGEQGRTRVPPSLRSRPGFTVQEFPVPCLCCRPFAFEEAIRVAAENEPAGAVFIEAPALGAAATIRWIENCIDFPLFVVACLDRFWTEALRKCELSPFQEILLSRANEVVYPTEMTGHPATGVTELRLP